MIWPYKINKSIISFVMQRISMDSNEVGVEDTTVDTGQSGGARHLIIDDAPRLF